MTKEELVAKVAKQLSIINDANDEICSCVNDYIERRKVAGEKQLHKKSVSFSLRFAKHRRLSITKDGKKKRIWN